MDTPSVSIAAPTFTPTTPSAPPAIPAYKYIGFLTAQGFIVPEVTLKTRFGPKYSAFLAKLTATYYPKVGPPMRAVMYERVTVGGAACVRLPRGCITALLRIRVLENIVIAIPAPQRVDARLAIALFDNQNLILDYLMENVFTPARMADGTATAILNLRAGMGKSFVAGGLIARLCLRTLFITPKRPLAVQGVKDLRMCLYPEDAPPSVLVGRYDKKPRRRDPSSNVANQGVTVIVINSAMLRDEAFFSQYSLVIIDEVHMCCSEQRRGIFRKCAAARAVLGMSATTEDRSDGFDVIAHKELAVDGIIRAENIPRFTYEDVVFDSRVDVIQYNGPAEYTRALRHESTGRIFTPYMITQLLSDPHRMKLAVAELRALYDWRGPAGEKHCIYVFCEERDPLRQIHAELKKSFDVVAPELDGVDEGDEGCADDSVGEFIGGIKDETVNRLKDHARILLTTYGYSSTGISIDKMTAILFLTPRRAQMKQILARILRRGGDLGITRRIIDIVDNKTSMKYQYGDRALAYEFYGMDVVKRKVNYADMK
jgi:hypothetical protein